MQGDPAGLVRPVSAPLIPWWLRNRHLQSIYPSFPARRRGVMRRAAPLLAASREWIIDCGTGVRLLSHYAVHGPRSTGAARSLALLLHGWEGSSDSLYILALAQHLYERGFDVLRLNLRDHGASHHLNAELFHSCRIAEVVGAVQAIQARWPGQPLNLVGFSLGGNFWLRVGARAAQAGLRIERIVAISPVLDPERTLAALEGGHPLYRAYFVWKWTRSLRRKQQVWPDRYDFREILRDRTLTSMTDVLVRRYTDFPDLGSYLRGYALTGDVLAPLTAPARIIAAADDPMIPADDLARIAHSPQLRISLSPHGGHCGFVTRMRGPGWIAEEIVRELEAGRAIAAGS